MARRFAFVLLGALVGCAEAPDVPFPGGEADAGSQVFADTVIAYTSGGVFTSCAVAMPPPCGQPPPPCAANAALGPNDATTFLLEPNGRLEVAFRCNVISDKGIKMWAAVPGGASAVVEVSEDGTHYETLGTLNMADESFPLTRTSTLSRARNVRFFNGGSVGIPIDAVEALR